MCGNSVGIIQSGRSGEFFRREIQHLHKILSKAYAGVPIPDLMFSVDEKLLNPVYWNLWMVWTISLSESKVTLARHGFFFHKNETYQALEIGSDTKSQKNYLVGRYTQM
jgi:hypothetical protein